jgi:hypothetical protein
MHWIIAISLIVSAVTDIASGFSMVSVPVDHLVRGLAILVATAAYYAQSKDSHGDRS